MVPNQFFGDPYFSRNNQIYRGPLIRGRQMLHAFLMCRHALCSYTSMVPRYMNRDMLLLTCMFHRSVQSVLLTYGKGVIENCKKSILNRFRMLQAPISWLKYTTHLPPPPHPPTNGIHPPMVFDDNVLPLRLNP